MKQKFIPGQEWLYFKIYLPVTRADSFIASLLKPMSRLEKIGVIDRWFFIRFTDPQFHVRLRLHVINPDINIGAALTTIRDVITHLPYADTVEKVVIDTYIREIDRYGSQTMEDCEAFFWKDSQRISRMLGGEYNEEMLWQSALSFIVQILDISKPDDNERLLFVRRISGQFLPSVGLDHDDKKTLNLKYRDYRAKINKWLDFGSGEDRRFAFSKEMTEIYRRIAMKFPECTTSLIHMHCNRLFNKNQRLCEAIAYYLLSKYYSSRVALTGTKRVFKNKS